MAIITKELAERIAKKLKAQVIRTNKAHDIVQVFHEGKWIASFGIRRGSRKEAGHDHIPDDLFIRPREAKLLGQCPLSMEEWINIIREKGRI